MRSFVFVFAFVVVFVALSNTNNVSASVVLYVSSLCGTGNCRTARGPCLDSQDPSCGCVPSQFGQLCVECAELGYIDCSDTSKNGCVCTCYDQELGDPNNAIAAEGPCSPVVNVTSTLNVITETSRVYCEAWCSRELGCFAQPPDFIYGTDVPPPIRDCVSIDYVGPPPATIRAAISTRPPEACNSYGGPDPNAPPVNASWTRCSGHGTWDASHYRCGPTCDRGWALENLGSFGIYGEPIVTCSACAPLFGPPPDRTRYSPPFCVAPWTPDPLDGVSRVCGGHGTPDTSGECVCFNGTTIAPVTLQQTFEQIVYTDDVGTAHRKELIDVTVASCVIQNT